MIPFKVYKFSNVEICSHIICSMLIKNFLIISENILLNLLLLYLEENILHVFPVSGIINLFRAWLETFDLYFVQLTVGLNLCFNCCNSFELYLTSIFNNETYSYKFFAYYFRCCCSWLIKHKAVCQLNWTKIIFTTNWWHFKSFLNIK